MTDDVPRETSFPYRRVLILGGTGFIGSLLTQKLFRMGVEVFSFSRDWHKLPKVDRKAEYHMGDASDRVRLKSVILSCNPDLVINTAAMKDVVVCGRHVSETVKINFHGHQNLMLLAEQFGSFDTIFISSDKACDPTTVYGFSKSLAERLTLNFGITSGPRTNHACARYGNVWGSKGSIGDWIPKYMIEHDDIALTLRGRPTRFWFHPNDATDFIIHIATYLDYYNAGIVVPRLKSTYIEDVFMMLAELTNTKLNLHYGTLAYNEKEHEIMVGQLEEACASLKAPSKYAVIRSFAGPGEVPIVKMSSKDTVRPSQLDDLRQWTIEMLGL